MMASLATNADLKAGLKSHVIDTLPEYFQPERPLR
jgi:hypothetical protein